MLLNKKGFQKPNIIFPKDVSVFNVEKDSNYFSVVSRKSVLLVRSFFAWGYCDSRRYVKIAGFPTPHKPFYDSWRGVFVDRNAMAQERQEMSMRMQKDRDYLRKIAEKCQSDGKKVWGYSLAVKKADLTRKTDVQLQRMAAEGMEGIIQMCAYLLFPLSMQAFFEEAIKSRLAERIKGSMLRSAYFEALISPSQQNLGYFEQVAILRLASLYRRKKEVGAVEKRLKEYLFMFDGLGVKYGVGKPWTREDVIARVAYLSRQHPEKRVMRLQAIPKQSDEKAESVLKKIRADTEFKRLVQTARLYVYLRTYRTDMISGAFANMFPLFAEIGRRNQLSVHEIIECVPSEILDWRFPSRKRIQERAKASMVRGVEGQLYYAFGDAAVNVRHNLLARIKTPEKVSVDSGRKGKNDEIQGVVANKGRAQGTVRMVFDNADLQKVHEGDILVSPMTTPDFIPAMEKAAAFVTDEGGITCHAAIVSREMNKPCIIGTKAATKLLKDGDRVAVDADAGIVRILRRVKRKRKG